MSRPVTLFTGQWADLPLTKLAPMAKEMGFDGLELACWGDHFDVYKAAESKDYCHSRWKILTGNGLTAFGISNHLAGQAICDNIDERHQAILPPQVWGDGHPEGVRQRAAENMKTAARACRNFLETKPHQDLNFAPMVCGFTGSSIWHACYAFPPTSQEFLQKGFDDFAQRFLPILDAFDAVDVNFALEVHPTEIAFDIASAHRALESVKHHKRFGFNYDPSHLGYQGVDYVKFLREFKDRIYHAHMKDAWWGHGTGDVGVFGGHTNRRLPLACLSVHHPGPDAAGFRTLNRSSYKRHPFDTVIDCREVTIGGNRLTSDFSLYSSCRFYIDIGKSLNKSFRMSEW
jgi:sugar phosphate isomerase/epimerase